MGQNKPIFSNKQIFQLVWPLIVEQLLNVLVGMIDVLMVAVLGEAAVSGVSLVDSINMLVFQVLAALTAGGTVVCSQYIGKKDQENSCHAAGQLFMLTVSGASIISLLLLFGRKMILGLIFGQVELAVMENAYIYCMITALSFPFLAVYNSGASIFRAMGNSRISMIVSLVMNGMNIVGNAICIFGLHMGVSGVAIPTLISRITAALIIVLLLQKPANPVRVAEISDLYPNGYLIRKILSIGIPSGLESGIFNFGKLILQSLVSTLGTASIAGYAVACNLVTFLYLPGNALGLGLTTVVGQCVGAGEIEQAKRYSSLFLKINYAILLVIGIPLGFGRHFWVGLYNLTDVAAGIAASMVLAHTLAMVIWPPSFLRPYFFRACNRAKFTMEVSVFCMWVFRVGLAYVFVKLLHGGVETVWYAMFIDWVFRFIILQYSFHHYKFSMES